MHTITSWLGSAGARGVSTPTLAATAAGVHPAPLPQPYCWPNANPPLKTRIWTFPEPSPVKVLLQPIRRISYENTTIHRVQGRTESRTASRQRQKIDLVELHAVRRRINQIVQGGHGNDEYEYIQWNLVEKNHSGSISWRQGHSEGPGSSTASQ